MHVSYDTDARATYIQLRAARVARTIDLNDDDAVMVDLDSAGDPIGVEFLMLPHEIPDALIMELEQRFPAFLVLSKDPAWRGVPA